MTSMFLNIPLIVISSLGILCNGYIVTAVLLTRQVTTANNILLLHLGAIDVLLGVLFLIFTAGFSKSEWLTNGLPCVFHGFLYNMLHPLALWTICGLNCDRYYAIAAPLHYSHIVNAKKMFRNQGFSGIPISISVARLFFSLAAVTDDNSPIIVVHTKTYRRRTGAVYRFLS
ncbi:hypothetical protein Zmor_024159 [Zophobas morio]|uniref:G-protein coupled receptors family 1 profile domain-containing protein n=1 Tax=Zophobas morio TaxID=2755281 RepID=A0AA38HZK0_9CUCU|nr:hypothetical protein Zmor_024159 [Zophobas morio]